ncbi:hypothetical protein F9C11_06805 [Amycolatopsis sp. VS8301801F10]|uniref:hypothetical protein n=1 Tax=Amycolatopsis sp. VS8301801F10 TaxID=2652442 RepID=UPI0038FC4A9D
MTSNTFFPDFPESDLITIPRPRSLVRLLAHLVGLRTRRLAARDRGATLVDAARILSDSGRPAQVVSRDPAGGEWSVTLGPAAPETA